MLNRKQFPTLQSMVDVVRRDYPIGLFYCKDNCGKTLGTNLNLPYTSCCFIEVNHNGSRNTWINAPASVPYDETSTAEWLDPFLGVESSWLKKDLGLEDEKGDFRFLFGKFMLRNKISEAAKIDFYAINQAEHVDFITHILALQKVRNKTDEKTECYWRNGPYYLWRATDTSDGYYWILRLYPLGYRCVADDAYYWEKTDTSYRSFDRFVEARKDYVRTFCAKLLAAWNDGMPTEALVPDKQAGQGAVAKGDDNATAASALQEADDATSLGSVFHGIMMSRAKGRPEAGDTVSDTSNVNPKELCAQLNARLNALRMQPGFESLESYIYDESRKSLGGVCFTLVPTAKTKHSPAQALCHVERLEYFARMRQKYIPYFKELRERISAVEGMLHTEHPQYAEIEIPAGCFDVDDKVMDRQRFSYAPKGVVAAREYVQELEKGYTELLQKLNNQTEN